MPPDTPPAVPAYDPAAYWTARLAADASLEGVGWQGLGRAYNGWLYRQRGRVFNRVARHYHFAARPPRVLEIGPGSGYYVERWARLGVRELTGIDIAAPAVRRLAARYPDYAFHTGDIGSDMALPAAVACDVVTAFDVLFHITDDAAWERALSVLAGSLRPGGLALISDLFPRTAELRLPHQTSRTAAHYRERLTALGLRLERRWPVFVTMHPWADTRSPFAARVGRAWWWGVERIAGHVPGGGAALGGLLWAVDGVLTARLSGGPSTELWALRRTAVRA